MRALNGCRVTDTLLKMVPRQDVSACHPPRFDTHRTHARRFSWPREPSCIPPPQQLYEHLACCPCSFVAVAPMAHVALSTTRPYNL